MSNEPSYVLGLDLGQAVDYSALAVLECRELPNPERSDDPPETHYVARGLKRWPLGTSYVKIVADVEQLVGKPPLEDSTLVIDASGVGRPVYDLFENAMLPARLVPVVITSGQGQSYHADGFYHVAKIVLISSVMVPLQQRRVQFAPRMRETAVLVKELQNYRVKLTKKANETFAARDGENDDLVLALALACWQAERQAANPRDAGEPLVLGPGRNVRPAFPGMPGGFDKDRFRHSNAPLSFPPDFFGG